MPARVSRSQARGGLGRELLRVVEVRVHPDRVVALEHARKARRVTRNGSVTGRRVPSRTISTCGIARSSREQPFETLVARRRADRRPSAARRGSPASRRIQSSATCELALLHRPLFVAHHALAQAEAAVERALVVDAERDAIAVDAHHVLHRRVRHLVERIGEPGRIARAPRAAAPPAGGSGTRGRPDPSATRSTA